MGVSVCAFTWVCVGGVCWFRELQTVSIPLFLLQYVLCDFVNFNHMEPGVFTQQSSQIQAPVNKLREIRSPLVDCYSERGHRPQ